MRPLRLVSSLAHLRRRRRQAGEFIHAAPWSVQNQGKSNVSHGCVGLSTDNAGWLFSRTNIGDVVEFTGSDRKMEPGEGMGVWLYSWDEWKALSAVSS